MTRKQILMVVLLAVAAGTAIAGWQLQRESVAMEQRRARDVEQRAALNAQVKAGMTFLRGNEFERARPVFEAVLAADPTYKEAPLDALIAACDKEIPTQQRLDEAEALLAKGELAATRRLLDAIPSDTTQYTRLDALKPKLARAVYERVQAARPLLDFPLDHFRMRELQAVMDDVLIADPQNTEALQLLAFASKRAEAFVAPAGPPSNKPWEDGQARFALDDHAGAKATWQACAPKHRQCKDLLQKFEAYAVELQREQSSEQLVALIKRADELSGPNSSGLSRTHRRKAADALVARATRQMAGGNWVGAIDLAHQALKLDPTHQAAQALVRDVRQQAKDLYLRIHGDGELEVQIQMLKDVMVMTPPDDEYHQKAKKKLEELSK